MRTTLLLLISTFALCAASHARDSDSGPVPVADWRVPIHTAPADPVGGAYGTWASGPTYKVSFHEGVGFYPVLGSAYPENLPLTWRTESICAGGKTYIEAAAEKGRRHSDWRYEIAYPGLTEVYDILPEGLEQSFVLDQAPPCPGDVIVTGRLETRLSAEPQPWKHGELLFHDAAGQPILRYGAALAFDAAGRYAEVETRYDGARIQLRLSGSWLAGASYPVTIDPLTSRVEIGTWAPGTYGSPAHPDVVRDDENDQVLVVYTRQISASDFDAWGRLVDDDLAYIALIFSDVNTWSTREARVAYVGGADRWVVAQERVFTSPTQSLLRVYLHDDTDTGLNTGTTLYQSASSTDLQRTGIDLGGTAGFSSGDNALLVYQEDVYATPNNTDYSEVYGMLVDATNGSLGTPFLLRSTGSGTTKDREWPSVSQISDGGTSSWVVAFQEYDFNYTNDDWDAYIVRVEYDGTVAGTSFVGPTGAGDHKMRPQVEGRGERFLASFGLKANTGKTAEGWSREILVQRFDWPESAASPTKQGYQTLASRTGDTLWPGWGIGYDSNTESHWGVGYHEYTTWNVYLDRVGYRGGLVEHATLHSGSDDGFSVSVSFNDDDDEYIAVWASRSSNYAVYGRRMQYSSSATNTVYGTGCSGTISASSPHMGSEFFRVNLSGGETLAPTGLMLGFGQGNVPLGGGCYLNLDPFNPIFFLTTGTASASGSMSCTIPLPDEIYVQGNVYTQWIQFDASARLVTTAGLRSSIH